MKTQIDFIVTPKGVVVDVEKNATVNISECIEFAHNIVKLMDLSLKMKGELEIQKELIAIQDDTIANYEKATTINQETILRMGSLCFDLTEEIFKLHQEIAELKKA